MVQPRFAAHSLETARPSVQRSLLLTVAGSERSRAEQCIPGFRISMRHVGLTAVLGCGAAPVFPCPPFPELAGSRDVGGPSPLLPSLPISCSAVPSGCSSHHFCGQVPFSRVAALQMQSNAVCDSGHQAAGGAGMRVPPLGPGDMVAPMRDCHCASLEEAAQGAVPRSNMAACSWLRSIPSK